MDACAFAIGSDSYIIVVMVLSCLLSCFQLKKAAVPSSYAYSLGVLESANLLVFLCTYHRASLDLL